MSKLAIINVGCNTRHYPLRSPIFKDKRFEFIPIPENIENKCIPKYQDLRSFYNTSMSLNKYIPINYRNKSVHNDPEFETNTYADYPTKYPRAANLKRLLIGDYILFLVRLVKWENSKFLNIANFYLIGYFEIEDILKEVTSQLSSDHLNKYKNNAHVRRALDRSINWNRFWIFKGSKKSRRFRVAVPFTKEIAKRTMVDGDGRPWKWGHGKTDLQVIGSYTRSCKIIEDQSSIKKLCSYINKIETDCNSSNYSLCVI